MSTATTLPDMSKVADAELDAQMEKHQNAYQEYQNALREKNRRQAEAEEKAESEKKDKFLKSKAYKDLLARYKKAKKRVDACANEQSITLTLPVTFKVSTDVQEWEDDWSGVGEVEEIFERGGVQASIGKTTGLSQASAGRAARGSGSCGRRRLRSDLRVVPRRYQGTRCSTGRA